MKNHYPLQGLHGTNYKAQASHLAMIVLLDMTLANLDKCCLNLGNISAVPSTLYRRTVEKCGGNMKGTVYSKPSCIQCEMTKMYLNQHKIKFETVDVFENEGVLEKIKSYGFQGMPVVVLDDNFANAWAGYNPDRLAELEKGNKYD